MFVPRLAALLLFAACLVPPAGGAPAQRIVPSWRHEIPRPVYPDAGLVELYDKAWEIASGLVRRGPEGLPVSPYLDENCYDDCVWIWDSCFMALFSKYAPKSFPGLESLGNFYGPMYAGVRTPLKIFWLDNPPIFAWIERAAYDFSGNKKRLDGLLNKYGFLQKHFDWFGSAPKGGTAPCGANPLERGIVGNIGFTWTGNASGMDNTPRGRDAGGYDQILWVDAISQQALSALCIADMQLALGNEKESRTWRETYERLKNTINTLYWDDEDGFYYDINLKTQQPSRVKTIASLWPLMARVASPEQAARIVERLRDPSEFGGERPLPSLARSDPDFDNETGNYWRGAVWLPTAYMAVKALESYGYGDLADELAHKVLAHQERTYRLYEPHTIWECYSPNADAPSTEAGRRARPDFCGWSALGPVSLFIENVLGFYRVSAAEREVCWRLRPETGSYGIRGLRFGPIETDIVFDGLETIAVSSNAPYTLVVNGERLSVEAGEHKLAVPRSRGAQAEGGV